MNLSLTLDLAQLLFTIVGVISGVILFIKSNKEKKNIFIIGIYDRFYNDTDIRKILYYVDKDLKENKIRYNGELEMEADKTLRFLDLIGQLIRDNQLRKKDIRPFSYEIDVILNNTEIRSYLQFMTDAGVNLKNLELLNAKNL